MIVASLLAVACVDTQILPNDKTVEEDFWKSKSDVQLMVNGAYQAMLSENVIARLIIWGELRSEEVVPVSSVVSTLQEELVRAKVLPANYDFEGHRELVGMQPGDVPVTYADSKALEEDYGFRPAIDIRTGLRKFAEWYKDYYKA